MQQPENRKKLILLAISVGALLLISFGIILNKTFPASKPLTAELIPLPSITPAVTIESATPVPTAGSPVKTVKTKITTTSSISENDLDQSAAEDNLPTPTATPTQFEVTDVSINIDSDNYNGSCTQPVQFIFTAAITANGAGIVSYKWLKSNGEGSSTPQTITFPSAGTRTVTTSWTLGKAGLSYTGGEKMLIVSPNSLESNQATFSINCS